MPRLLDTISRWVVIKVKGEFANSAYTRKQSSQTATVLYIKRGSRRYFRYIAGVNLGWTLRMIGGKVTLMSRGSCLFRSWCESRFPNPTPPAAAITSGAGGHFNNPVSVSTWRRLRSRSKCVIMVLYWTG